MEHVAVHLPYVGPVIRGDGWDTTARNCTCRKGRTHHREAGDEITLTDICSEAGVVNRSISTYVIVYRDGRGFVVARSQGTTKRSVPRWSTDTPVRNDEEEGVMARSRTFPWLCVASVTFCLRSASDIN